MRFGYMAQDDMQHAQQQGQDQWTAAIEAFQSMANLTITGKIELIDYPIYRVLPGLFYNRHLRLIYICQMVNLYQFTYLVYFMGWGFFYHVRMQLKMHILSALAQMYFLMQNAQFL